MPPKELNEFIYHLTDKFYRENPPYDSEFEKPGIAAREI
jgi:hypothetical protein